MGINSINDLEDQSYNLCHYHPDTWTFLPKSHDEALEMGDGHFLSKWVIFNVTFDRLAAGTFQGVTWSLDLDHRLAPQGFTRVGA